jgi:large subunit ribosomal protein L9
MEIILRQEVDRLGFPGDVVDVRDGYARNFLIPRGLAEPVTKGAMRDLQRRKDLEERREQAKREEFEAMAGALEGKTVTITKRAGSSTKLYGSVTVHDLQEAIKDQLGVDIERKRLVLEESVKTIGEHERTFKLATGVEATLTIEVKREGAAPGEEAEDEEAEPVAVEGYDVDEGTLTPELEAEIAGTEIDEATEPAVGDPQGVPAGETNFQQGPVQAELPTETAPETEEEEEPSS